MYHTHSSSELAKVYGCSEVNIRRVWRVHGLSGKDRRVYYADFTFFDEVDTEAKAYFLGFIAADGCITKYRNQQMRLQIAVNKRDEDVIYKFKSAINATNPVRYAEHDQAKIAISSDSLCAGLQKHGVTERKSHTYAPIMLDEELMPHFLRGYFDGDGTIHCEVKSKPQFPSSYGVGITCNVSTAEFIRDYLKTIGIETDGIKMERRSESNNVCDLRIFRIVPMYKFLNLIYENATVYMDRKYEAHLLYKAVFENKRRPLTKIDKELV